MQFTSEAAWKRFVNQRDGDWQRKMNRWRTVNCHPKDWPASEDIIIHTVGSLCCTCCYELLPRGRTDPLEGLLYAANEIRPRIARETFHHYNVRPHIGTKVSAT